MTVTTSIFKKLMLVRPFVQGKSPEFMKIRDVQSMTQVKERRTDSWTEDIWTDRRSDVVST
jgi:hypothetical protein